MMTCDRERLKLLLSDELPAASQAEVAEHVAGCESCRKALETLAGDATWWAEVEMCLRASSAEQRNLPAHTEFQSIPSDGSSDPAEGDSHDLDFVVDFLEPCDEPQTLGRLGEYEIREIIGRGGMGVVLKGFHRELGRLVAVKVMAPHLASSGAARQRFIREARAAAAIVHPCVMPIHSVCTTSRLPYLVMPFVACESLQQRLDRQGPLEVKEILRIGMQAAAALAAAHAQGLIHRDVKPANILLEKGVDRVVLTDFGLARAADDGSLTRTGIVSGTPQYMSPEQAQGDSLDSRSDLFSLGSVLYAMAAGWPPFRAETTLGVLRRISDTQPRSLREVNPEIPAWLEQLIQKLHEKSLDQRFQTAAEVSSLLEQCLAHLQQPKVTLLPKELLSRGEPGRFGWWDILAVSGSALLALVFWIIFVVSFFRDGFSQSGTMVKPSVRTDQQINRDAQQLNSDLRNLEHRTSQPWDSPPKQNGNLP